MEEAMHPEVSRNDKIGSHGNKSVPPNQQRVLPADKEQLSQQQLAEFRSNRNPYKNLHSGSTSNQTRPWILMDTTSEESKGDSDESEPQRGRKQFQTSILNRATEGRNFQSMPKQ